METDLAKLKCGDCCKCHNTDWGQHFCDEIGLPIGPEEPACISISPKLSARERRECKDNPGRIDVRDSLYFEI